MSEPAITLTELPDWMRGLTGAEHVQLAESEATMGTITAEYDRDETLKSGLFEQRIVLPNDVSEIEGELDPLILVHAAAQVVSNVEAKLDELVAYCRRTGKSWTEIGRALGTTKQAAWERYSGED